jgi:hypothetical protein
LNFPILTVMFWKTFPEGKFLVTNYEFGDSFGMSLRWVGREFVISFIHNFITSSLLNFGWPKILEKAPL